MRTGDSTRAVCALAAVAVLVPLAWIAASAARGPLGGGYVVEHDADVRIEEPAPHRGGGESVGYKFFETVPDLHLVFRKRVLRPGAAIGYHPQKEDEIYYVLSGSGVMTVDDHSFEIGPGAAILTRPGSSHGLRQTGDEDLVVMIVYEQ